MSKLHSIEFDFKVPQILQRTIFLYTSASDFAKGLTSSSRLFINFKTIRFADLGPKPGSLDISLTSSSISLMFCMNYKGHLKPGIPKPPVAFEISSEVFDFN